MRAARARSSIAAALALAAAAFTVDAASPARGLIVQLKDAPAHERVFALRGAVHPDAQRWKRVLDEARIAPRRMKPSGRAAQLLDFDRVLSGEEAQSLADELRRRPDVEWVVPNERERRLQAVTPNDQLFGAPPGTSIADRQWWLYAPTGSDANSIEQRLRGVPGFVPAWSIETGQPGAVVAMLDTGITCHPELGNTTPGQICIGGRVLPGYDFVSEAEFANDGNGRDADPRDPGDFVSAADRQSPLFSRCDVEDSSWHGTTNAGLVGAVTNNLVGVAATHWNARILPVRVAGKCGADVADIVDGMRWAAGLSVAGVPVNPNPARIVNISFGGSAPCNAAYQTAIDELRAHGAGVVVVAAAGNENAAPSRPASCANVVGVAALNRDGFKASYSNFGSVLKIATVGGDPEIDGRWDRFVADSGLLTIGNRGLTGPGQSDFFFVAGTSFSAPLVSGVASLMLSINPALTADQLVQGLQTSARPHVTSQFIGACSNLNPGRCLCSTSTCGAGILDAERALRFAQGQPLANLPLVAVDNADVEAAARTGADRPPNPVVGSGGGGALGWGWLAGLALAVALLAAHRRRG